MVSSWFPGSTFVVDLANSYAIALTLVIFLFIFVGAEFLACIMAEVKICDARQLEIGKHGKLPGSSGRWGQRRRPTEAKAVAAAMKGKGSGGQQVQRWWWKESKVAAYGGSWG
jgi:hypothetical protein